MDNMLQKRDVLCEAILGPSDFSAYITSSLTKLTTTLRSAHTKTFLSYNTHINELIAKYKDDILAFDGEFTIPDYVVFNYNTNIPSLSIMDNIKNIYLGLCNGFKQTTLEDLNLVKNELLGEANLNVIRGKLLNSKDGLSEEEFKKRIETLSVSRREQVINKDFIVKNLLLDKTEFRKIHLNITKIDNLIIDSLNEVDKVRSKHSVAQNLDLKSTLVKTSNLTANKRVNNLTKEEKVIAYNIDLLYLQLCKVVLQMALNVHSIRVSYAIESQKQILNALLEVVKKSKQMSE